MKICIFSESYLPVRNGVSFSIMTLREELQRQGHRVYVAAPSFPGYREDDPDVFRFPSVCTWRAPDYPLAIPYMPRFVNTIRRLDLDVIHTHTPFMLGLLGLRVAKRLDIPVVSTNHTQYAEYAHYLPVMPVSTTRSVIVRHMRSYYNKCDGVIVPSCPVYEMLREYGIRKPVHVIPTGNSLNLACDPEARVEVRKEYGIPEDAEVILYVGRLAREKNLSLLMDAFDRIASERHNAYLLIVGGGPYESECRSLAENLVHSDRAICTGSMPRESLARFYSAGDVFAFPSVTETQGLVICEALSVGLPAVVVRAGGSQEMVIDGEDGFLTENDVTDFSDKISSLLSDREMRTRLSEGALRNSRRFSTQEMTRRMLEVYESVIVRHGNQSSNKVFNL